MRIPSSSKTSPSPCGAGRPRFSRRASSRSACSSTSSADVTCVGRALSGSPREPNRVRATPRKFALQRSAKRYKELSMRVNGFVAGVALASAAAIGASAQTPANTIDGHVAAARAAAGTRHVELFSQLCAPANTQPRPAAGRGAAAPAGGRGRSSGPPPRAEWHAEPAKVFDNLYWVGQTQFSAWAVKTSAGIIVIDALYDYSVEDEIVGGLTKL